MMFFACSVVSGASSVKKDPRLNKGADLFSVSQAVERCGDAATS